MQNAAPVGAARPIHPLYAILLASPLPLFLGAVLSNWAYSSTYQVQWTNFASWLMAGGLVFLGAALVWAIARLLVARRRHGWISLVLILVTFVVGFITALVLAKDAWAAMPAGLILSIITLVLAATANWAAYSRLVVGERA